MHFLQRMREKSQLSDADFRRAEEAIAAHPDRLAHEVLLEKNIGHNDDILNAVAEEFGMELVDLSKAVVSARNGRGNAKQTRASQELDADVARERHADRRDWRPVSTCMPSTNCKP